MTFKPIGERHAIQEVVFVVGFARAFTPEEIDRAAQFHSLWKSDLPKFERPNVLQFAIGEQPPDQAPPPVARPAIFQSFKRDGSIDWQMQIRDGWIAVNCLSYSRWEAVSRQAKSLFEKALGPLVDPGNVLSHISLQYIDTFIWEGNPEDYDIDLLINRRSGFFADSFHPASRSWHYHQGEFEFRLEANPPCRILKRIHLDATDDETGTNVKIDTLLRSDFKDGVPPTLECMRGLVDQTLNELHAMNKIILANVINEAAQDKISLIKEA